MSLVNTVLHWAGVVACVIVALLVGAAVLRAVTRKRLRPNGLKGKKVVITGASSGIGAALAEMYARHGASVVLAARRKEKLDALVAKCRQIQVEGAQGGTGFKPESFAVACDVSVEADCKKLVEEATSLIGGIDILVLNAGISATAKLDEVSDLSSHRQVMETNYWGCVYPTFHALPALRKTKGSLIVVSSLLGLSAGPLRTAYSPSKFALHGFFDSLRYEVTDVSISIVCPGYVVTEIHDKLLARTGQERNLSKFMSAEEAARITIEAGLNKDRVHAMTAAANLLPFRAFLPYWLVDRVTRSTATSAFTGAKDKSQ